MLIAFIANTRMDNSEFHVEYDPPHTINLIKKGVEDAGHKFVFIEADTEILSSLKEIAPDLVINRAEGLRGESRESHVPAVLEMLGIPYVGSNVLTTAVCLNKSWAKKILSYHGIKTPGFVTVRSYSEYLSSGKNLNYPLILKPNDEGSSMGIDLDNVVNNNLELESKLNAMEMKYNQEILAEEFISGREFSVGALSTGNGWQILPILEIDFSKLPPEIGQVFGQYAKTLDAESNYVQLPAQLSDDLETEITNVTIQIMNILEIKDFARLDFRYSNQGNLYFLEVNPLPGMDFELPEDFSFYPLMADKAGLTYSQLIDRLIKSAAHRYGLDVDD